MLVKCSDPKSDPGLLCFCLQDDKDLVPEFVASEGLTCFIKVGAEADHNYQNYILRGETPSVCSPGQTVSRTYRVQDRQGLGQGPGQKVTRTGCRTDRV